MGTQLPSTLSWTSASPWSSTPARSILEGRGMTSKRANNRVQVSYTQSSQSLLSSWILPLQEEAWLPQPSKLTSPLVNISCRCSRALTCDRHLALGLRRPLSILLGSSKYRPRRHWLVPLLPIPTFQPTPFLLQLPPASSDRWTTLTFSERT